MRAILPIVSGIILFAVLIYFSAAYHKGEIEADLTARTRSALGEANAPPVEVSAEAQTITLHGEVASEDAKKKVQEEASRVWGVTEVRNQLQVKSLISGETCAKVVDSLASKEPIPFHSLGFEIDPSGFPTLDRIAGILSQCQSANLIVEGHGNAGMTTVKHEQLAEARASSVVNYLVSKGIPATMLTARASDPVEARDRITFALGK